MRNSLDDIFLWKEVVVTAVHLGITHGINSQRPLNARSLFNNLKKVHPGLQHWRNGHVTALRRAYGAARAGAAISNRARPNQIV